MTLGLVLDGSGFVLRSRMFEGNVAEASTMKGMLRGLDAPAGALVIMDRGIATGANISWLIAQHYQLYRQVRISLIKVSTRRPSSFVVVCWLRPVC